MSTTNTNAAMDTEHQHQHQQPHHHQHAHAHPHHHQHSHSHNNDDHHSHDGYENKEIDEERERAHFEDVVEAFAYYDNFLYERTNRAAMDLNTFSRKTLDLPLKLGKDSEPVSLYDNCMSKITQIEKGIKKNMDFINEIIKPHQLFEENDKLVVDGSIKDRKDRPLPTTHHMNKVTYTVKQFVRDWSEEGKVERDACYQPIIDEVLKEFTEPSTDINILVPGAGLGRLVFDLACKGYATQGNEFSMFMLIASNFILNCSNGNKFTLHPFVHQYNNYLGREDQNRAVVIPDVNISEALPKNAALSMAAGDFLECYTEKDHWDCVSSVFFIDTAKNIVEYLQTIYDILKPGGIFINIGPLLYHFEGMSDPSLELSYEEVRAVIESIGFVFEKEEIGRKCPYVYNHLSMYNTTYDCVFFVVRKPRQ